MCAVMIVRVLQHPDALTAFSVGPPCVEDEATSSRDWQSCQPNEPPSLIYLGRMWIFRWPSTRTSSRWRVVTWRKSDLQNPAPAISTDDALSLTVLYTTSPTSSAGIVLPPRRRKYRTALVPRRWRLMKNWRMTQCRRGRYRRMIFFFTVVEIRECCV